MLHRPTIEEVEICCTSSNTSWMTPIIKYLQSNEVPAEQLEAKKLKREASKYILITQRLYRRGFSYPLLRCLDLDEARYAMMEVHEGICGTRIGKRSLASKITRTDYCWPTLKRDYMKFVSDKTQSQRKTTIKGPERQSTNDPPRKKQKT
ncbi:hypothetical protein CR513_10247, partial [Mucuna pruriens]